MLHNIEHIHRKGQSCLICQRNIQQRAWHVGSDFHHAVSPTYDKEAQKLYFILQSSKSFAEKEKHFEEFTNRFTTTVRILWKWDECREANGKTRNIIPEEWFEQHFPRPLTFRKNDFCRIPDLVHFTNCWTEPLLKPLFDNSFDNEVYFPLQHLVAKGESHIPIMFEINFNNYKSSKTLPQIKQSWDHNIIVDKLFKASKTSEWIAELEKTEDYESIINNIYHVLDLPERLAEEKKQMWEYLFHFSRKHSFEKHLEVYRRFCRYYVDNIYRRKKYRAEIQKAEKNDIDITKWELDSIKLEDDFGSKETALKMLKKFAEKRKLKSNFITNDFKASFQKIQKLLNKSKIPASLPKPHFSTSKMIQQNFAFQIPMLRNICKNANYEMAQKLQHSSKQLYLLTSKTLCFRFSISKLDKTVSARESLYVSADNPDIPEINNIWIENTLFVYANYFGDKDERDILSKFIPKIQGCSIRFLILCAQDLSLKEYSFLTSSRNIKRIVLVFSSIFNDDDGEEKMASLEALMQNLPNAEFLKFFPSPSINAQAFSILKSLKRNIGIRHFEIQDIHEKIISEQDLCSFFEVHFAPNSNIELIFKDETNFQNLLKPLKSILNSWNPFEERPIVKIMKDTDNSFAINQNWRL